MVKKVDTESANQVSQEKSKKIKKTAIKLFLFIVVCGFVYLFATNPNLRQKGVDFMTSLWGEKVDYQKQINQLNMQVSDLQQRFNRLAQAQQQLDFSYVDEKISNIEKLNQNIIDSKADVATILGVITRMDKAEERLDALNKISDDSALILTAAMLVKDSAERGGSFEYEADVLQELSKETPKFKDSVALISEYASSGIVPENKLVQNFNSIYKSLLKEQKATFEKTWKDRLNSKLNELVQIKRVHEDAPKFKADAGLEAVKKAVDSGNLTLAINELKKADNQEFLKNEQLKNWLKNAEENQKFYAAINRISAASLAIMKVKFLKKNN